MSACLHLHSYMFTFIFIQVYIYGGGTLNTSGDGVDEFRVQRLFVFDQYRLGEHIL